ncbi:hypothetical protein APA_59 [Pseudanabaena sp. lw0831]|nr:hypothetical protein APA_59 [Pseudanabaena sp. lw0831]
MLLRNTFKKFLCSGLSAKRSNILMTKFKTQKIIAAQSSAIIFWVLAILFVSFYR